MTPGADKLEHQPALDGLRAVAVLAVMGFHYLKLVPGGFLGVDIFFVLSGYLITRILRRELARDGAVDVRAFLVRRARRIIPALAVLLVAYPLFLADTQPGLADRRWLDTLAAGFYVTNVMQALAPTETPLSPTWSLALEEQFYLLWPFVLPHLHRLRPSRAAMLLAAAWAALTAGRWFVDAGLGASSVAFFFPPLRATGLLLGAALAFRPVAARYGEVGLVLLALLLALGPHFTAGIPLVELATVLVIAAPPRLLALQPLTWIGRTSYGIYLWHVPVQWAFGAWTVWQAAAVSLGLGSASYLLVERRFLRGSPARRGCAAPTLASRMTAR